MSEFTRRNVLGAATGSMIATAASMQASADGQPPFGPTPAPLAGATLPSFRFALGAVTPKSWDGGWAKEATVAEFPVSEKLAGVLMSLAPGALRTDEWQYYISGRARMSVFGSHGRVRTEEFNAGDVGYVPQGYGHYIENAGSDDLDLLIVLNNGHYESISLSAWMAANPHLLLATNFRVPESTFANFPPRERFMPG